MKIAIVRGPGLSKWEMQIYEPLSDWFEICGIGSTQPVNDISRITFPIKQLVCPLQFIGFLPFIIPVSFRVSGDTQWLMGFDQAVNGVDLIHAVELRNAYSYQAVRAKKKGLVKAVTLSVYENIPFVGDEINSRRRIKEEVMAFTDHFFAANDIAKQTLICEGVKKERISIIPQAIDTHIFKPNPYAKRILCQRLHFAPEDVVVLGCGRLVWEKGIYDFVRTAAYISQTHFTTGNGNTIRFVWVGDGPEKRRLSELVIRLGLSNLVKFVGLKSYKQMPQFYQAADIFVLPSLPTRIWNEQFGGVLIEAMACGLPIVGADNGGIGETLVQGGNIGIAPQNFYALSRAIIDLVRNPKSRRQIGKLNRQQAIEKYDIKVVALAIRSLWDEVLVNAD